MSGSRLLLLILSLWSIDLSAQKWTKNILISKGDSFHLSMDQPGIWVRYVPLDTFYEPLPRAPFRIGYGKREAVSSAAFSRIGGEPGIQYWLYVSEDFSIQDTLWVDPTESSFYIIKVRRDDTYLGILEEMIGVPFVLGPMHISTKGHLTDLGLGVDCAELAIYGKRRQGHDIPYGGPRGIIRYLDPIPYDALFEGCLIHFHDQVSILYRDRPPLGKLNAADILIQSFEAHVRTVSWEASGFYEREFQAYTWEEHLPK